MIAFVARQQGQQYGDKSAATLQREHIIALMAQRADKPDSANGLRKVLRAMMRHAVQRDHETALRHGHSHVEYRHSCGGLHPSS
jgi:hypothetical protein